MLSKYGGARGSFHSIDSGAIPPLNTHVYQGLTWSAHTLFVWFLTKSTPTTTRPHDHTTTRPQNLPYTLQNTHIKSNPNLRMLLLLLLLWISLQHGHTIHRQTTTSIFVENQ